MNERKKKVLIISYYWPPSGGIGVLRSLKIAKYITEFGWEPVVYCPSNADYSIVDTSNDKDIPQNITIIRRPIIEPFSLFKFLTQRKKNAPLNNVLYEKKTFLSKLGIWIRANFFIPDARFLWIKPSVSFLVDYLKKNPVDAIFTDGPPHTNTLIGCLVSKKLDIPWLADFQDPWTQVDYYKEFPISFWADLIHKKLEQKCFKQASSITIVSNTWKDDLEAIGAKNVKVLEWGFDEDDFKHMSYTLDSMFSISHIGLLGKDRVPSTLLKVLADKCTSDPLFKLHFRLKLTGTLDESILELIKDLNLEENVIISSNIPRSEALKSILSSQVLLLLLNKASNAKGRIPGKIFEYLRAKRPIIVLGPINSDSTEIITSTKSGVGHEYDDYEGLKNSINTLFQHYLDSTLYISQKPIDQYNIRNITKKFALELDRISR